MFVAESIESVDQQLKNSLPNRPRRVAIFTGNYNHIADGVAHTLNKLVAYLEKIGTEVMVFGPTTKNPVIDHEGTFVAVPSVFAPGRPEYRVSLGLGRKATKILKDFNPDLIHIATPDFLGRKALKLGQKWGVPVVSSFHTNFANYLQYYGLEKLEDTLWGYLKRFYDKGEHVYVPSDAMADEIKVHGINKGVKLWERGVDMTRFNPERRSMAWRRMLGIADDEVLITFVSRLVLEKSVDIFADTLEGLTKKGIKFRSMMVGEGPAREMLEKQLPNTIFMGHLGGNDLARAYASSDIFFFPSQSETFGNVTLEAMASGVPSLCADAPGSSSLVVHGSTGFLAESNNVAEFLEYAEKMVTDPKLRFTLGQAALLRSQNYHWDAIMGKVSGYYDEILSPDQLVSAKNTPVSQVKLVAGVI